MRRIGPVRAVALVTACTWITTAFVASITRPARAGGFETPDNGTEALGRGGAFTAKASDATALQYNVAGFAAQRGTRVLFDGKVSINNYSFTRFGTYPDKPSATTPWGNSFFPSVSNQGAPFFAPFLGVSSDLGMFDRLTFAVGAFGPSGAGNPTYPLVVGGTPSPSRYDVVQVNSVIVLPTIAAAYRVNDWLDVGLAFHYVYGSFDLINVSFADIAQPAPCLNVEYEPCDTVNHLIMSGSTFTGSVGVMAHPSPWMDLGLHVRGPINITAKGAVTSSPPGVAPAQGIQTGPAQFSTSLPAQVRLGARVKLMEGTFEQGDVELDAVYEPWSATGAGPAVSISSLQGDQGPSPYAPINTTIVHNFRDVYSLRLGGAYNIRTTAQSVLTLRAGAYYESPATAPADTRLDFNTMEKYAGTIGVGFTFHGIGVNVAYAGVVSPERVVTDGQLRPINPVTHGQPTDTAGKLFPAVNNGKYDGFIHMISFGVRVELETIFGTKRSERWTQQGTSEWVGGATPEAPKEETKPEAKPGDAPNAAGKPAATPPPPPPPASKPEKRKAGKPAPAPAPAATTPPPSPPPGPAPKPTKPTPSEEEKERRLEDPFAN